MTQEILVHFLWFQHLVLFQIRTSSLLESEQAKVQPTFASTDQSFNNYSWIYIRPGI